MNHCYDYMVVEFKVLWTVVGCDLSAMILWAIISYKACRTFFSNSDRDELGKPVYLVLWWI